MNECTDLSCASTKIPRCGSNADDMVRGGVAGNEVAFKSSSNYQNVNASSRNMVNGVHTGVAHFFDIEDSNSMVC